MEVLAILLEPQTNNGGQATAGANIVIWVHHSFISLKQQLDEGVSGCKGLVGGQEDSCEVGFLVLMV